MAKKKGERSPPQLFKPDDVEFLANQLRDAADNLSLAAVKLQQHGIAAAYFQLSNLQNTLMGKVLAYARDANGLADDEVHAKRLGIESERTKNVNRYRAGVAAGAPGYARPTAKAKPTPKAKPAAVAKPRKTGK
jgi:hypothetical protein